MEAQRKMTVDDHHFVPIVLADLLHRRFDSLAEWTLKIRVLDDRNRCLRIAADVIFLEINCRYRCCDSLRNGA